MAAMDYKIRVNYKSGENTKLQVKNIIEGLIEKEATNDTNN